MSEKSLYLSLPQHWDSPIIFSSPHSGSFYPKRFRENSILDSVQLRSSEDAYVDEFVAAAPLCGAPVLAAKYPRAFVDVNRGRDELDSALIEGIGKSVNNPRVASGLGVIPRVVSDSRAIQSGKISKTVAEARLKTAYDPYHSELSSLIAQTKDRFGCAVILDMHSMPHDALNNVTIRGNRVPEIILGDRFGASAAPEVIDLVEQAFEQEGFVVSRNIPFAGAYITRRYGRPIEGVSAIQVEIDRALYLHEATVEKSPLFNKTKSRLSRVVERLTNISFHTVRLAAE